MVKLLIATPVYSELKVQYVIGLLDTVKKMAPRYGIETFFPKSSAIHQARNWVLAKFLKDTTLTHVLFVDSDIAFTAHHVLKLLDYDKEFCAITYRAKTHAIIGFNFYAENPLLKDGETGLIKAEGLGGGFIMLKRSVVEKMARAYPELKCIGFQKGTYDYEELNKFYFNFFDWGVNERTNYILSEDFTFCHRWRKIGGEIWVDPDEALGHIGDDIYHGKLKDNILVDPEGNARYGVNIINRRESPKDYKK